MEAVGIEPTSRDVSEQASTRVVHHLILVSGVSNGQDTPSTNPTECSRSSVRRPEPGKPTVVDSDP